MPKRFLLQWCHQRMLGNCEISTVPRKSKEWHKQMYSYVCSSLKQISGEKPQSEHRLVWFEFD